MTETTTNLEAPDVPTIDPGELAQLLQAASRLPGKAPISVAVLVCSEALRLGRREHVMVTPRAVRASELSRVSVYRGLAQLEHAGLVRVQRVRGQSPLVTIHKKEDS